MSEPMGGGEGMKIYLICPVREINEETCKFIGEYVDKIESNGNSIHYPPRDVNQDDSTGLNICLSHLRAIEKCDEVHIYWDVQSKGSHFDLGMAFALKKPIFLFGQGEPDNEGKSYLKVIQGWPFK